MRDIKTISHTVAVHETPPLSDLNRQSNKSEFKLRYRDFIHQNSKDNKKAKPFSEKYLIIGFDTEFQTPENILSREQVSFGLAKYEVLSYQFHCLTSDGDSWSGICCPEDGNRISLSEFIVFALGKGIREKSVKRLPTRIYLAGHFTRADMPAFSDFKDMRSLISAVRNTFLSLDQHIAYRLAFRKSKDVELKVSLRDTMLLTPGTSKSLDTIGQLVGRPKILLDPDKQKDRELKSRMRFVRDDRWDVFKEYALNDAIICVDYLAKIIKQAEKATGEAKVPVTLTSIGIDLLIDSWKNKLQLDENVVLGNEVINEKKWDKKLGYYKKENKTVRLAEVDLHETLAVESYHGGRNEQFWFGPCYQSNWTDYDLASAYPTAMGLIGLPAWREARTTNDLNDFQPTALAYGWADFKFPENTRYPTLPVRTENGLVFPLEGSSYCAAPEIFLARQLGCEIRLKHGVVIPSDAQNLIFAPFIADALAERARHPKKSLDALFWKEISNSTYGKTAQGLRGKRVYDMRDQTMKPLPPSRITNPFLASFITSFVRAVLGEIINSLPEHRMVFSCTTDGFLTDADSDEIAAAQSGRLGQLFAESRERLTGTRSVLETKHAIAKPLGWRTRGQATLVPGDPKEDDGSYHVILARGGISIPDTLDDDQERSKWICELFFNRTPEDSITSRSLTGIRDIVELDSDLVGVEIERRLNMEFDWKRKPYSIGMSKDHKHLVFSTKAWKTVDEFMAVREQWNDYRSSSNYKCLKTPEDFIDFQTYCQSRVMLGESDRKYLRTRDADLARLRQSLCSAWKKRKAGFEDCYTNPSKDSGLPQTASQFALTLTDCGIDTARTDVENNAKRDFVMHSCPPTQRGIDAFNAVSARFGGHLRKGEIFSVINRQVDLETVAAEQCPFVSKVI